MSNLKVGFAEVSLVPKTDKKISLVGQFYERIAEYVETPVTVTAMACEQDGRTCYTMELDPRYVDANIDRWQTFTGEKAVLISE